MRKKPHNRDYGDEQRCKSYNSHIPDYIGMPVPTASIPI